MSNDFRADNRASLKGPETDETPQSEVSSETYTNATAPTAPAITPDAVAAESYTISTDFPSRETEQPVAGKTRSHTLPNWIRLRWMVLVAAAVIGYWHSGVSIVQQCQQGAPLEVTFLVFAWAFLIALGDRTRQDKVLAIDDRQVDWTTGVIVLIVSMLVLYVLTPRLGAVALSWRTDVLSFWLFMFSGVALLFGLRSVGRYRKAWIFALFSWPLLVLWFGALIGGGEQAYALVTLCFGVVATMLAIGGTWLQRGVVMLVTSAVGGVLIVVTSGLNQALAISIPSRVSSLLNVSNNSLILFSLPTKIGLPNSLSRTEIAALITSSCSPSAKIMRF